MRALREQRSGEMRLGRDEGERHRRLTELETLVERGARSVERAAPCCPQDPERAVPTRGVQAGLRAEQAKLREAARAAQLGGEARAHPCRKIVRSDTQRGGREQIHGQDRKSTRLNSSHRCISYAVFC